jgi:chlorite dismutase
MFSLLGHKGDLMFAHFRTNFEELNLVELALAKLPLWDYFEQTASYLSVVELGLYDSTGKVYAALAERGVAPHSPEWKAEIEETLERQRAAMRPRLFPEMPPHKYICFYPMDRRRGEHKNWYQLPFAERQRQMQEHGEIGRRYAGAVKQIISGSIGFDDLRNAIRRSQRHLCAVRDVLCRSASGDGGSGETNRDLDRAWRWDFSRG